MGKATGLLAVVIVDMSIVFEWWLIFLPDLHNRFPICQSENNISFLQVITDVIVGEASAMPLFHQQTYCKCRHTCCFQHTYYTPISMMMQSDYKHHPIVRWASETQIHGDKPLFFMFLMTLGDGWQDDCTTYHEVGREKWKKRFLYYANAGP